jgi:DNA-binding NtrC family response regulator
MDPDSGLPAGGDAQAAVVLVFSGVRPRTRVFPLAGDAIELGRDQLAAAGAPDGRVSQRHVRIERADAGWTVRDLDSKNGTFVEGRQVQIGRGLASPLVRIGRTLLLPVADGRPFEANGLAESDGVVRSPSLRLTHERIAAIARTGTCLLVLGESGSGKELCAAKFHAATRECKGPFVSVNCATIPRELAERTLFGARRGAYTGAVADADGLVQAADGGTLFLDEIAELDLAVQAKLLRVLESKEVTAVGATKPTTVDLRVCAATHKNLRAEVVAGRFREDLYFRIGRPEVRLPPLRERREEIPLLLARALSALPTATQAHTLAFSVEFVEACMVRAWPGNVRELLAEATTAAITATTASREVVLATDLDECAGQAFQADEEGVATTEAASDDTAEAPTLDRAAIEAALRAERGNLVRTAARLGITRSRLRRFIEREQIDVDALRD